MTLGAAYGQIAAAVDMATAGMGGTAIVRRRVDVDVILDHPVERVFAYLADPGRWHEFAPAVAFRRQIGGGPRGIGSRWTAIDQIGPIRVQFVDELVEHVLDRRVVWSSSSPWNAITAYDCEPVDAGTRVRARYEGDVAGRLRLLAWVPTPILAWFLAGDFRRLRTVLDREATRSAYRLRPSNDRSGRLGSRRPLTGAGESLWSDHAKATD